MTHPIKEFYGSKPLILSKFDNRPNKYIESFNLWNSFIK